MNFSIKNIIIILITLCMIRRVMSSIFPSVNVLGKELKQHGTSPVTGFYRDGYCNTGEEDGGKHVVAGIVSKEFLEFSKQRGNDLMTPSSSFPGLTPGCRWCLCVERWKEAYKASKEGGYDSSIVPRVDMEATHKSALDSVSISDLQQFAEQK
eukprot:TRINITY_DN1418_c0_g1_i2.p1 TRINITY_DN1418_c0_g1~~TRINITY_DN1418_c0_g1_i2.p1  ORF type:complete len:153 (+),score=37.82 TRINITY_DN1418_c0_g1_i2:89-547(+)